jgi:hypothetical protein
VAVLAIILGLGLGLGLKTGAKTDKKTDAKTVLSSTPTKLSVPGDLFISEFFSNLI